MKMLALMTMVSGLGVFVGQALPEPITPWVTSSAAVTLSLVVGWLLMRTIPSLMATIAESRAELNAARATFQATLDRMGDRHERWETLRHEDSEGLQKALRDDSDRLNETLRGMTQVCSRVQDRMLDRRGEKA